MGVDNVDVFEVEALEGGTEAFDDVLAAQAVVVDEDLAVVAAPVELGADDDVVALPAELLDGLAHDDFGLASGVAVETVSVSFRGLRAQRRSCVRFLPFRSVKKVDTQIIRLLQASNSAL